MMNKRVPNLFTFLLVLTASVSTGQASIVKYEVQGVFFEPMTQQVGNTVFNGAFDWDGGIVSNLNGTMNSSMYVTDDINPDYGQTFPLMRLNYQLAQDIDGNIVTASVFLKNTTDVFLDGGYRKGDFFTNGDENAYFSFSFDKESMKGNLESIVYADCTQAGMMGKFCMTGSSLVGTMNAVPFSLTISEVSAVPVPAAVWLFGSALLGLLSISHKRTLTV